MSRARRRSVAPGLLVLSGAALAGAGFALGPSARTPVLALAGGILVGLTEAVTRLSARRRWPSRSPGGRAPSVAADLAPGLAGAALATTVGWAIVTVAAVGAGGPALLGLGGVAAVVAVLAVVFAAAGGDRVRPTAQPAPSPDGRPPGRGARPARSGRPDRRGRSSG